jgi:hypothetical protein
LLELPHAKVGFYWGYLGVLELLEEADDLGLEVGLGGELFLHVAEHLELDGSLLVLRGLHVHGRA